MKDMFKCKTGRWADVLTCDPGTIRSGLAYWSRLERPSKPYTSPDQTFLLTAPQKKPWQRRVDELVEEFSDIFVDVLPDYVVIEFQELWTGSGRSMASGSRGELFKVSFLVGQYARVARKFGSTVILVEPTKWKGQLSKQAIDLRIKRALGKKYPPDVSDAVGMGLAIQGAI